MKKKIRFFGLALLSTLLLSSCSFFNNLPKKDSDTSGESNVVDPDDITDFEFVLDDKLVWVEESYGSFYRLTLNAGERYQVRTNLDGKLGESYRLDFSSTDEEGFTIARDGLIIANTSIDTTVVGSFTATLYKTSIGKRLASHYAIVNVHADDYEYATLTLQDSSLNYDQASRTYTLNLTAGGEYQIATSVLTNTDVSLTYSLVNSSYASFMDVSSDGLITTSAEVEQSKTGKVIIKAISDKTNLTLDFFYVQVNITPDTSSNMFSVAINTTKIKNGDEITMYQYESITLTVLYNHQPKYNVLSTTSTDIQIDQNLNKITALNKGTASITAICFDYSITFTLKIFENQLIAIYDPNEGKDFVVVNDHLFLSGQIIALFSSGYEEDVTNSSDLTYTMENYSFWTKKVRFSFTRGGITEAVIYEVKFFNAENYVAETTAFDFNDYGRESLYGEVHYLSNSGDLKFLVVPVWFTNSGDFFNASQKQGFRSDIEDKILGSDNPNYLYSVKSFYEKESRNELSISATITEFYEVNYSSTTMPDVGEDTSKTRNLAEQAANWYFDNNPTDNRSNYDLDNDGRIDGIILFYAAYYYGSKDATQRTTAYAWAETSSSRHYNTACFCSLGGIYGFTKSTNTSTVKNATDLSAIYPSLYARGSNHVIHEVGHMFGAVDLYEYATSGQQKNYPCGAFSMQDNNTGGHEPYHTNLIGWTKPDIYASDDYNVGDTVTIVLDDFQSSGNNIVLSKSWNEYNSLYDEYLILELFTPTGLNEYDANKSTSNLNKAGFRVWHVNSVLEEMTRSSEDNPYLTPNVFENGQSVIKYSTYDRECEYDVLHLIRNDKEAGIDCTNKMTNSDLFVEGDEFNFADYSKQFVNGNHLDNEQKLGWSFKVEKIFKKEEGKYSAVITLEKVDSEQDFFRTKATMGEYSQPSTGPDASTPYNGKIINDENLSLTYQFNDSVVYEGASSTTKLAISSKGIQLFGEANGNGGSIKIVLFNNKGTGYSVKLLKIKLSNSPSNAVLKVLDEAGNPMIKTDTFVGPLNPDFGGDVHDSGSIYDISSLNLTSVKIQNCFTGTVNHWSATIISTLEIEYQIVKN